MNIGTKKLNIRHLALTDLALINRLKTVGFRQEGRVIKSLFLKANGEANSNLPNRKESGMNGTSTAKKVNNLHHEKNNSIFSL